MAGYQLEKISIGFKSEFLLTLKLDSVALPRQGYTEIKKTQFLLQTI